MKVFILAIFLIVSSCQIPSERIYDITVQKLSESPLTSNSRKSKSKEAVTQECLFMCMEGLAAL